jgi:hypothetical protein
MPHSRRRRLGRAGAASPAAPPAPRRRRGRLDRTVDAESAPAPTPAQEATLAGYRLLRRLAAGDRADVYLAVVDAAGAGREGGSIGAPLVVMRVYGPDADDEAITAEIEAMDADPTGTLPSLIDVATVPDGRGCIVVERVSGRSLAEILIAGGLAPGRIVTALAPIVVALRHLGDRGLVHTRLAASDVLVDDGGRPRLLGLGALSRLDRLESASDRIAASREGHAVLLRLIEDAADASTDRSAFDPVIGVARAALDARPFRRVESEIERALFAVAPARPLVDAIDRPVHGMLRSRPAISEGVRPGEERHPPDAAVVHVEPSGSRLGRLAELAQLPPSALDELAVALDGDPRIRLLRRATAWARRRRPVLLTGGFVGAAALVALLSTVPPSSAGDHAVAGAREDRSAAVGTMPRQDDHGGADESAARPASSPPEEDRVEVSEVPDDPLTAAAALLEIRATCLAATDLDCVLAVDQPGSPIAIRDRAAIAAGEAVTPSGSDLDAITLTADLGDAVVVTVPWVEAGREPASLLMMRSEAGWRLREWFD